ncbi:hypothetical protein Tco_1339385 [Tanacetum coccineum]
MAASGSSRLISEHAVNELVDLSGETKVPKFKRSYLAKLHVMNFEMEAMDDHLVVFDSLECLKESKQIENNKLKALLDILVQTKDAIRLKEGHVDIMDLSD